VRKLSNLVLQTLSGSRAYGLDTPESDTDLHGIYLTPTSEFLKIGAKRRTVSEWNESERVDNVDWELGHFLDLATRCNPTVLESFVAPVIEASDVGVELRTLLPEVLSRDYVYQAFSGYAHNQQKKLLAGIGQTNWKFAAQCLRVLFTGIRLVQHGKLILRVEEFGEERYLRNVRAGKQRLGEVIERIEVQHQIFQMVYNQSEELDGPLPARPNIDHLNEWLIGVRQQNW